ncbi:hypothetical protein [Nonomuraea sp. NPDC049695]|uniref:hypothetical protein n=1 Tax=Nonomuraea sp. NPDC049695 TaxID=3154734 RepID=UPI003415813C
MENKVLHVSRELGDDWAQLIGRAPHTASQRWLSFGQSRVPESLTFRLVSPGGTDLAMRGLIQQEPGSRPFNDPYLIASGQATQDGLAVTGPHPWQTRRAQEVFPSLVMMYPNYDAFPVGPLAADSGALASFADQVGDWARRQGFRSVTYLYLTPEADALRAVLRDKGYDVFPLAARSNMTVTWSDIPEYLAQLPRKRRGEVRRELRALEAAGVRVRPRPLAPEEPGLVRLRSQLMYKYASVADEQRERHWFARVWELFGDDATVFVAEHAASPIQFTLFVQDGAVWTPLLTGTDYAHGASRLAYFATAFYSPAALAPQLRIRRINYGLGASEAKRHRGCHAVPLYAAVTCGHPTGPRSGEGSTHSTQGESHAE